MLVFPKCSGKCEGCQNYQLQKSKSKTYKIDDIVELYNNLSQHKAIVCAGLEPFDSFDELFNLFTTFYNDRRKPIDFVIYTGYEEEEIRKEVHKLISIIQQGLRTNFKLIIKFGRYDKNDHNPWFSNILGVELVNDKSKQYVYSYKKEDYALVIDFEQNERR